LKFEQHDKLTAAQFHVAVKKFAATLVQWQVVDCLPLEKPSLRIGEP
jgi:hypothetical protein